ncbi:MAG TPA: DUF1152 domain-containing protein [Polyangiaceae bacterium]|nr:DUF1152 domain-containing protein [Polyangiaceae bacterium]
MELGRVPLFEELADAKSVLIAGAGGGFDVYCGLPLYFALQRRGKQVHLANLSFAGKPRGEESKFSPTLFQVTASSGGSDSYFPEKVLAQWFRERGEEITVSCFELSGVKPLQDAYETVVASYDIDTIVLVDGGTDSLMRGDESGLGTPAEDIASIAAVHALQVPRKLLVCLGFGVDHFHGVSHHDFLEAVAELTREGAFYGAFSLLPGMPEGRAYLEAVDYANSRTRRASIVNSSIASAIEGRFGDYHRTDRTQGSELWINPLMAQYFCFDLMAVARRVQYLSLIRQTEMLFEITAIIEAHRKQIGIRRRFGIPL